MNRNGDRCIFDFEIPLMRLVWVHSQRRDPAGAGMHMYASAVGGVVIIHSCSSALAFRPLLPSMMDRCHS